MTIEEAWDRLDERCGQRMKLDKDAARAYGLAVAEDAIERAALHDGCPPGTEPQWAERFRDQINALGSPERPPGEAEPPQEVIDEP